VLRKGKGKGVACKRAPRGKGMEVKYTEVGKYIGCLKRE
jgi:hypothetical protein